MTSEEFKRIYPVMANWIEATLRMHSIRSRSVASVGFKRLPLYFSNELLNSTKFVVVDQIPVPPLSAMGLQQFADFESGQYAGITYLDTFFVDRAYIGDERLYFHELIHVIQWRLLGVEGFLWTYADGLEKFGYRNSPLEVMAYGAEAKFVSQSTLFNAEELVKQQLLVNSKAV